MKEEEKIIISALNSAEENHLIEFEVAGLMHRSSKAIKRAEDLMYEEFVYLVKEPTNPHDKNAIKVITADDIHIGYVPRFLCTDVAELMDGDMDIAYVDYIKYGKHCPFVHLYME